MDYEFIIFLIEKALTNANRKIDREVEIEECEREKIISIIRQELENSFSH